MPTELPTTELLPPLPVDSQLAKHRTGGPLVHPLQTSDSKHNQDTYRSWASRSVNPHLVRYDMILSNGSTLTSGKHLERLRGCRTRAWFTVHRDTRAVRVASNKCNLRWCPMCQQTKRYIIADGVSEWITKAKHAKFLTLTLKSSYAPLRLQLQNLYAFFRKFRRRQFPAKDIHGGFWFFQVTYNNAKHQWHPHLHCLIDSEFLPQRKLSNLWKSITKGSSVVDIRTVTDAVKSAQYVARYATSPCSLLSLRPDQGAEVIEALTDQRIVGAWGSARGTPLAPRKPEDADRWVRAFGFKNVIARKHVHPVFQELYQCWRGGQPFEGDFEVLELGCSVPDDCMLDPPEPNPQLYFEFSGPLSLVCCTSHHQSAPLEY